MLLSWKICCNWYQCNSDVTKKNNDQANASQFPQMNVKNQASGNSGVGMYEVSEILSLVHR